MQMIENGNNGFCYEYDFGDEWFIDIKLTIPREQKKLLKPTCIDGKRAAPPEDCGGVYGYAQLCRAGHARPLAAGVGWTQSPGGAVQKNNGAAVPQKEKNNAVHDYGWQVSGPFTASVVSPSALVIRPASLATNLTDGTAYQGPFRIIVYTTQQIQWQNTSLTYTPGVSYTAGTEGIVAAANTVIDSNTMGPLWPGSGMALQVSPTVAGVSSNITYWVEDMDW